MPCASRSSGERVDARRRVEVGRGARRSAGLTSRRAAFAILRGRGDRASPASRSQPRSRSAHVPTFRSRRPRRRSSPAAMAASAWAWPGRCSQAGATVAIWGSNAGQDRTGPAGAGERRRRAARPCVRLRRRRRGAGRGHLRRDRSRRVGRVARLLRQCRRLEQGHAAARDDARASSAACSASTSRACS